MEKTNLTLVIVVALVVAVIASVAVSSITGYQLWGRRPTAPVSYAGVITMLNKCDITSLGVKGGAKLASGNEICQNLLRGKKCIFTEVRSVTAKGIISNIAKCDSSLITTTAESRVTREVICCAPTS